MRSSSLARSLSSALLASTALSPLAVHPAAAQNLPTGYSTAYGAVGFQRSPGTLTINQSSQNAIVNYNSFSIGQHNVVDINQPNASSALLNRVTGNTPSTIAGQLNANGQVYLINPNGIAITKTGVVKVGGGFVASSLDMSDSEFKHGRRHFKGNGASASVTNAGTVTIGRGGYAALIGGTVTNSGLIAVPMGKVGLGSGEMATLDVSGDGFLQVAVPTSAGGKGTLISNSGRISAAGGMVVLDAATARAAARNAVNISGDIDAHSIGGRSGSIIIGGGAGGTVTISGHLSVASRKGTGGSVTVTGRRIALKGAHINASGKTGGGTIKIGGDLHGGGTLAHAGTVTIDTASVVKADATGNGNGGTVVVWSDETTSFAGLILATGGPHGGNGGQVEVSSHGVLTYTGLTTLTAANGAAGTLLLDPYDVVISNGTDASYSTATAGGTTTDTATNTSVINATTLDTQLAAGNVTITTGAANSAGGDAGNITVAAPVAWSSGSLLTLTAANAIAVNATISITGGGKLALNMGTTSIGGTTQPLLSFAQGASVTYASGQTGQALSINGAAYKLEYSLASLAGDVAGAQFNAGNYALARNIDASGTLYTNAVVLALGGTLEGLGHTVSNLTITGTSFVGLIGNLAGAVRDIGIAGGSVSGNSNVGELVGESGGVITNAYATGSVSGSGAGPSGLGGLVGDNGAAITQSYATGAVSGGAGSNGLGGLVGNNTATITQSYATGAVSGSDNVGGLAGVNVGAITRAYATGAVSGLANAGNVGGLVGDNNGAVAQAYATGAISGGAGSDFVGGLVGLNQMSGTITTSYATGAVSGYGDVGGLIGQSIGTITQSYATGAVSGSTYVGGLVGDNDAAITQSYATGVVSGNASSDGLGGLVGLNEQYGTVAQSYATGAVSGPSDVGGLVGLNTQGTTTQSYWDTQTTGQTTSAGGTGLTTRQLQGLDPLPSGTITDANHLGATFAGGTGGLYPYLVSFFPNGVQAVSGVAYKDLGVTPAASGSAGVVTVSLDANGGLIGQATTGANGYYYITLPAGSLASRAGLLASTPANSGTGAANAATVATSAGAALQSGVNLYGNILAASTASLTLSGVPSLAGLQATATSLAGTDSAAAATVAATTVTGYLATGASFTIDGTTPLDLTASLLVLTEAGAPLIVADAITVEPGAALGLVSGGALRVNAPITAQGASAVALGFDASDPTNLSFAPGAPLTYVSATGTPLSASAGGGLSVNGTPYTLEFNLASLTNDVAAAANNGGGYALAANIDATGASYTGAVVPTLSGALEGLGHTVSNLTITGTGTDVGLIGTLNSGGVVRDIGMVGGAISGFNDVGGLVGYSDGTVAQAYATGVVSGSAPVTAGSSPVTIAASLVGGLVGFNDQEGIVAQSHATGAVSDSSEFSSAGGLVGGNAGTITQSYATGAVSAVLYAGGLVGGNAGTITQSYATGAVSGLAYTIVDAGQVVGEYIDGNVGGLAGDNFGMITQAYATGVVSGATGYLVQFTTGGLVGENEGAITQSYATAAVSGAYQVGGLVGLNLGGTITQAYATGAVSSSYSSISIVGGLVGENAGPVAQAYATGAVSSSSLISFVGGLVGGNGSPITQAYATGAVSSTPCATCAASNPPSTPGAVSGSAVGGLVGENGGAVTQSYATGAASSTYLVSFVGGLVGLNDGTVAQAYATGAASSTSSASTAGGTAGGNGGGSNTLGPVGVGGLVGTNSGMVTQAYATGAVSGDSDLGGLVGSSSGGTTTQSYWDTQTTGQTISADGGTGLSTRQLQGPDPLSSGTITDANHLGSAFAGGTGGLYPYLVNFFPDGVQAVSGVAYSDRGVTPFVPAFNATTGALTAGAVFVDVAGAQTQVTTGANGYYYVAEPAGTFTSGGTATLAYTTSSNAAGGTVTGASLIAATGTVQHLDIWDGALIAPTARTSLSDILTSGLTSPAALLADAGGADQSLLTAATTATNFQGLGAGITSTGFIATGLSGLSVNTAVPANGLYVQTTAGPLTVSTAQTVANGTDLSLYSTAALAIRASVDVPNAGVVNLAAGYDTTTVPGTPLSELSFGLTSTGFSGSLTFAAGQSGQTLSIDGTPYTLLASMSAVASINKNLGGAYALAANLDATSQTPYTSAVIAGPSTLFSGTFEGLGHTIANLTISNSNGEDIGFIGQNNGVVRDIGLVGGSVTSSATYVGALVGYQSGGSITDAYATGAVSGNDAVGGLVGEQYAGAITSAYTTGAVNGNGAVGGLVGVQNGTIAGVYATGAVGGSGLEFGGLVGEQITGTIIGAYATGAISGSGNEVGGLVGQQDGGAITDAYATGAVRGSGNEVGGLVGAHNGGTITNAYWGTQTSGQSSGIGPTPGGSGAPMGLATAQLQGTAPLNGVTFALGAVFAGGAAGGETGVYPYLKSFFPNGVQAVSGIAYTNAGTTPLASPASSNGLPSTQDPGLVSVAVGGVSLGTVTTGANGYYYLALPASTLPSGTTVLAYTQADPNAVATPNGSGATNAATYVTASGTNTISGANVYGGWRVDQAASSITTLTALNSTDATAAGSLAPSGFTLANREIAIGASSFSLDASTNLTGTLILSSSGGVTQTSAGTIAASALGLEGTGGAYALTNGGNIVATLAANTGSVAFQNAAALKVGAASDAAGTRLTGVTASATTGTPASLIANGGGLTLDDDVTSGGTILLAVDGAFINNAGAGALTTGNGTSFTIYTQDATHPATTLPTDVSGGLSGINYYNDAYSFASSTFASAIPSGNHFVYAYQASLTPVLGGSASKVYDGTSAAPTDGLTVSPAGLANAGGITDSAVLTFTGATFGTANAGMGETVTASGIAFASNPNNYTLTSTTASLTAAGKIIPAALTITASNQTKTYGQTANLGTTAFTETGLVNTDTLTGVALTSSGAAASATVGGYAITASNPTGSGLTNYTITYDAGTLSVTPALVAPSADLGSTVDRLLLRVYGYPGSGLPNVRQPIAGGGSTAADILLGLSDPRYDQIIVCVARGTCITVAPGPQRFLETSRP